MSAGEQNRHAREDSALSASENSAAKIFLRRAFSPKSGDFQDIVSRPDAATSSNGEKPA
jgi:hypothetical protein